VRIPSRMSDEMSSPSSREIRIRANVFDLISVDVPNHRFTVQFFVEVSWEDSSLASEPAERLCDVANWEVQFPFCLTNGRRYWTPRLSFENVVELRDREDWVRVYTHEYGTHRPLPHPVVCYRLRALGCFRERFELDSFPFDAQDLQLVFKSMREVEGDQCPSFRLVRNASPKYQALVPHKHFILRDEYEMAMYQGARSDLSEPALSSSRRQYPCLTISLKIVRIPSYYIWSVILPMFVFVGLGFLVLLLDATQLHDRLSIVLSLLLATVAYKTYIGDRLPVCNYLTWLDKYILLCLAIFGCLALENAAVFLIDKKYGRSSTHEDMEDTVGLVCVGAWIIGHMTHLLRQPAHRTQAEAEGKLEYTHAATPAITGPERFLDTSAWDLGARPHREQLISQSSAELEDTPSSRNSTLGHLPLPRLRPTASESDVDETINQHPPRRSSRTREAAAAEASTSKRRRHR
jgi:hypothetical protein